MRWAWTRCTGHFLGCAVGDYDNDGYDDLYISGYRTGLLLHNEEGKGFRDVTQAAGLKPQPWGTSAPSPRPSPAPASWTCSSPTTPASAPTRAVPQLCDSHGVKTSCGPRYYTAAQGRRFTAIWAADGSPMSAPPSGIPATSGRGLGAAFAPLTPGEAPSACDRQRRTGRRPAAARRRSGRIRRHRHAVGHGLRPRRQHSRRHGDGLGRLRQRRQARPVRLHVPGRGQVAVPQRRARPVQRRLVPNGSGPADACRASPSAASSSTTTTTAGWT